MARQSQQAHARYCAEGQSRKTISKSRGGRHRTLPCQRSGGLYVHSTILPAGRRVLRRAGPIKGTDRWGGHGGADIRAMKCG